MRFNILLINIFQLIRADWGTDLVERFENGKKLYVGNFRGIKLQINSIYDTPVDTVFDPKLVLEGENRKFRTKHPSGAVQVIPPAVPLDAATDRPVTAPPSGAIPLSTEHPSNLLAASMPDKELSINPSSRESTAASTRSTEAPPYISSGQPANPDIISDRRGLGAVTSTGPALPQAASVPGGEILIDPRSSSTATSSDSADESIGTPSSSAIPAYQEPELSLVPPITEIHSQDDLNRYLAQLFESYRNVDPPDITEWVSAREKIPENIFNTGREFVLNLPALFKGSRTTVFDIIGHPEYVIKYYKYCRTSSENFDSLVTEALFMKLLEPLNICPKVLHLSGQTEITDPTLVRNGKLSSTTCGKFPNPITNASIRYMMMEKVGESLHYQMINAPENRLPFRLAIEYGIQMIQLLERLHANHVRHGDAHMGNFAARTPGSNELILIDFGRAKIIGDLDRQPIDENFCTHRQRLHPYMSKWEMQSCKPAFRDDINLSVQMVAMAMHGDDHFKYLQKLGIQNSPEYTEIKMSGKFFDLPERTFNNDDGSTITLGHSIKTVSGITNDQVVGLVQNLFDEISNIITADFPNDPYRLPEYELIIQRFREILNLIPALPNS